MICWQKTANRLVIATNFNKYLRPFCYLLLHLGILIRSPLNGFCLKAGGFLYVAAMAPSLSSPHTSHTIITLTEFAVLLDARRRLIGVTMFYAERRDLSMPQPIETLEQKHCVFNMGCYLQTHW
jgi:hypothetical protein